MMSFVVNTFASILLVLCLACIHSAPLTEQQLDTNGIEYSKAKTYSYTNINGAEHTKEQLEEKVSDPEGHKVISDLKEKIESSKPLPAAKTETHFRASIDIPEKGIHEEISNDGKDGKQEIKDSNLKLAKDKPGTLDASKETIEQMKEIEFTPKAIAEYLFRKGEMDEFQALLNELVESAEISPEEAEVYEKAVVAELFKLQQTESKVNADHLEALYLRGLDEDLQSTFSLYNDVQGSNEVYPMFRYGINPAQLEDHSGVNTYINYLRNRPISMDQMVTNWIKGAILSGDRKDEELLADIMDYVSRDKNPNDEGQVKAILGDIFSEKLKEYLSPKYEPQYINTDMQNPAFIGHKWTYNQPNDVSANAEADRKTNIVKNEQHINDLEKAKEMKGKTDELEKELKM